MATRTCTSWKLPSLPLLLAILAMASGCGKAEEAVNGFAGGTSSKDKKAIPSAVQSSEEGSADGETAVVEASAAAASVNASVVSALEEPAPASKAPESDRVDSKTNHDEPIRGAGKTYRAGRVRDPFVSLATGDGGSTDLVDLSVVQLVGVVKTGEGGMFCIVEDTEGLSYILRKGDRVKNGRIVTINSDKLVASQTILGYTTTVQLDLIERKDRKHG